MSPPLVAGRFVPLLPARFVMNIGSGFAHLNQHEAALQRIGADGATFNFAAGVLIWDVVQISSAVSFVFPSDDGKFTQQVVPETGGGSPETAESSLNVIGYSIAAGVRSPFLALAPSGHGWVATAAFAEYGASGVGGGRSISNCSDCYKEDVNLPGGTFWRVGLDLLVPGRAPTFSYGVTVSYQRWAGGSGFNDELRIGLTGWLHSRHR